MKYFKVGVTTTRGTVLKGHSIRRVGNCLSRAYSFLAVDLPYFWVSVFLSEQQNSTGSPGRHYVYVPSN